MRPSLLLASSIALAACGNGAVDNGGSELGTANPDLRAPITPAADLAGADLILADLAAADLLPAAADLASLDLPFAADLAAADLSAADLSSTVDAGAADAASDLAGPDLATGETDVGYPTPFPDGTLQGANFEGAIPITLTAAATLLRIGLVGESVGPHVILGLYGDNAGAPGTLIASSAIAALEVGAQELPTAEVALAAGPYWIAFDFDAAASFGSATTGTLDEYIATKPIAFAAPLPKTFPTPTVNNAVHPLNFWIVVK